MAKEIYEKPIIEYTEYIVEEIMQESEKQLTKQALSFCSTWRIQPE